LWPWNDVGPVEFLLPFAGFALTLLTVSVVDGLRRRSGGGQDGLASMKHQQRQIVHDADGWTAERRGTSVLAVEPRVHLVEVVLVSVVVIALLGLCRQASKHWVRLLGPLVLVAGSVIPTFVGRRDLADLGLRLGRVRQGIVLLLGGGVCMLILGLAGLALFKHLSMQPPLAVSVPKEQWPLWVLFQLGCVAFPEELFFRGYFLSNSLHWLRTAVGLNSLAGAVVGVVLSAGFFAISHVFILGNSASVLTFFPALIFAGLFVKTNSLVPSILLHAAANVGYGIMIGLVT
jgi:membrane protease YdiL (CAAX protease family)